MTTKKDYLGHCEVCSRLLVPDEHHCGDRWGFRGCHETFTSVTLLGQHLHKKTGGCRFPGNIPNFYEREDGVWYKTHPNSPHNPSPSEDNITDQFLSSSSIHGVASSITWNVSERHQDDQHPGTY